MRIARLSLEPLRIPFRVAFKHASAERHVTQSALVVARSDDGVTGFGEGCPREYVTGETDATMAAFFGEHRESLIAEVSDLPSLREWRRIHAGAIDANPAAWCALELALLDLIAREGRQTVEALLGLPRLRGPFVYTAVLGAMGADAFASALARYRTLGLRDHKLKLSGDLGRDRANVDVLRAAGVAPEHARADANNLWSDAQLARDYLGRLEYPFVAIEEPLRPGSFDELAQLGESLGARVVLDESVTREAHLSRLPGPPERWIVNLRVSKMGGLLRSLDIVNRCRELRLGLIVGAQVGETSLLTRAALLVAQSAREILIGQEGAFGTMLLESEVLQPTLMFGGGGVLDIEPLMLADSPGFGLEPTPDFTNRIH